MSMYDMCTTICQSIYDLSLRAMNDVELLILPGSRVVYQLVQPYK